LPFDEESTGSIDEGGGLPRVVGDEPLNEEVAKKRMKFPMTLSDLGQKTNLFSPREDRVRSRAKE